MRISKYYFVNTRRKYRDEDIKIPSFIMLKSIVNPLKKPFNSRTQNPCLQCGCLYFIFIRHIWYFSRGISMS
jgi:hypothetical protein